MKSIMFIIIALVLLGGVGYYLFCRLRPILPAPGSWQHVAAIVAYIVVYLSFFIGFGLQHAGLYAFSSPFTIVGSWALAAIMYLLLLFVSVDIVRVVNLLAVKSEALSFRYAYGDSAGWFASLIVSLVVGIVLVCGYFNARFPVTRHLEYQTSKQISRDFRYVLISDVHLGMIHCDHFMELLRDRLNAIEGVDFIVVAGDFFDGDPMPVVNSRVGEILRGVNTGYGIYACTGNHEWIGDANIAAGYLTKHGVRVLRDSVASLPFGVAVVGREDAYGRRVKPRKSLDSLMGQVSPDAYSILLDHQPWALEEAERCGVDIELSGHTHAGAQLWPLCLFTRRMFENEYGPHRRGNTEYYTTSGYGTWGPPVRTSARPEIVVIDVKKKVD